MGTNRRKNDGTAKYYISEAYSATDFEYGEVCKFGADSSSANLKLDGAYAGPLEIRKDDFIGVTRIARAAGVGSVVRLTAAATTGLVAGETLSFVVKNIVLDGSLHNETFVIALTSTNIASTAAVNDAVFAAVNDWFSTNAPHYTVTEQSSTTVDIEDNIGGTNAHDKVWGYLEGDVELGFGVDGTVLTGAVQTNATKSEGNRGDINRFVDEEDFSTGDAYTAVCIDYWDRDADGRARGDVMVRRKATIYFNETDIAAATGTTVAHLNSVVDHFVAYAGLGEGDAINLTSEAGTSAAEAETRIPVGALSVVCTPDANNDDIFITAGAPVGSKLIIQNAGGAHTVQVRSVGTAETIDGGANLDIAAGKIRVLYKFDATKWIESAAMS